MNHADDFVLDDISPEAFEKIDFFKEVHPELSEEYIFKIIEEDYGNYWAKKIWDSYLTKNNRSEVDGN